MRSRSGAKPCSSGRGAALREISLRTVDERIGLGPPEGGRDARIALLDVFTGGAVVSSMAITHAVRKTMANKPQLHFCEGEIRRS